MNYSQFHPRIEIAARWARITSVVMLIIGLIVTLAGLSILSDSVGSARVLQLLLLVMILFYFIPAALLWMFARHMTAARLWSYYAVMVLCGLQMLAFFFGAARSLDERYVLSSIIPTLLLLIPWIILMVFCLNALPDVRDIRKAILRERRQSLGFPVISPANRPQPPKPPPPARTTLPPARTPRAKPPTGN